MAMRTAFDFSPLYRSSIGFDRVFDLLENASRSSTVDNWPPYDIAKIGENDYRITVAVAGFAEDELSMTQEHNVLTVAGQKTTEENGEFLHRGIAGRAFERRFQLADHVKVTGAELKNGLLTVDLKREIPEEMKPRRIAIGGGQGAPRIESTNTKAEAQKKAA
jgi:molecular chaperone IbpA